MHPDRLDAPGKWRSPRLIFVNSMSDLFHEEVEFEFIRQVFDRMATYSQHTYQVLTKRPERMMEYVQWSGNKRWPDHVWAGVSVENQYWADRRIPVLRQVPCAIRFLSCEPLLKPLDLDLDGINWVIVGGESGHRARKMEESWAIDIRDQCQRAGVAFFFKQWGGRTPKAGGRELEGRHFDAMPIWHETPALRDNESRLVNATG